MAIAFSLVGEDILMRFGAGVAGELSTAAVIFFGGGVASFSTII